MKNKRNITTAILTLAMVGGSVVATIPAKAMVNSNEVTSANLATMDAYNTQFAQWKLEISAWYVARVKVVSDHVAARVDFRALEASNQVDRLAISSTRAVSVAFANDDYAAAMLKTSSSTTKAALLVTRSAEIATANEVALASYAALPVLGTKPVWPVLPTRPAKPTRIMM